MVKKGSIGKNLKEIEAFYDQAKSTKKKFYFAKLAVLELCGWLENAQDELIKGSAARCILISTNMDLVNERIKRTYGFEYTGNFRPLLIQIVGLSKLERIEGQFDATGSLSKYRSLLSKLKDPRNKVAHNHTTGLMPTIDAPSVVRKDLEELFKYLRELERILKRAHC